MDANKVKIIVNGNCMMCKKELNGKRIFFCEECEKKAKNIKRKQKVTANKVFGIKDCEVHNNG